MRRRGRSVFRACAAGALLLAALAGGARAQGRAEAQARPQRRGAPDAGGRIAGVVRVSGSRPPARIISMEADRVCARMGGRNPQYDDILVSRGRLADALVYVEGAPLDSQTFAPPAAPAVLAHRRCRAAPRVLGLQAGRTLRVVNDDPTEHNFAFRPLKNTPTNRGLGRRGESFVVRFDEPEPPVAFFCNQHPWERGFLAVMPHPFFAVTDRRGRFVLEGLPPGEYTIRLWHERFRPHSFKVTIGGRDSREVNFALSFDEVVR